MNALEVLKNLPTYMQVVLGVVTLCQFVAMLWALVCLTQDKRERIAGLARPLWAVIIVFGQLIGPVVFLVVLTREHRAIAEKHRYHRAYQDEETGGPDASSVISSLYGE